MRLPGLDVGIAFDLRTDFDAPETGPDDLLEEYDSAETIAAIADVLAAGGHRPRALGGGRGLLRALLDDPPDLVFNICEGATGRAREAHAPAACEMLGVPYTHSDPLTLAVSLDKDVTKRLLASAGLPVPRHVLCDGAVPDVRALGVPVIAKPVAEGSSKGIRGACLVDDPAALPSTIARLQADYGQPVLVEEFCPGTEITVGVLGTGADASVVGSMEVEWSGGPPERFVYSLEVKRDYLNQVRYHVPPRSQRAEAEALGLAAHRALGCRDVSRVDVRMMADGRIGVLEINPLPGLAPEYGDLVILAERMGVTYDHLIIGIVDQARRRWGI